MNPRPILAAALLALVCLLAGYALGRAASPASMGAATFVPAAASQRPATAQRPVLPSDAGPVASTPGPILEPAVSVAPVPRPVVDEPAPELVVVQGNAVTGEASWGDGWSGIVTRLPRGTPICVTGKLGQWCGPSVGYGPQEWTGRIADLSRAVFADICGDPDMGVCPVVLTW